MISPLMHFERNSNFEIGISFSAGNNMFGEKIFGLRINFFWLEFYIGLAYCSRF